MNKYKKKLIKGYILKTLAVLSLIMIIIPIMIAAFESHILIGIWVLGCFIGIITIIMYSTDDD